jgi:uncharacterized protein involved in exopolysaccharide biosynthesis
MNIRSDSNAEMEIDLRALFSTLLRKLPYLFAFVVIIAAGAMYGLGKVTPTYTAEATILIQTGESALTQPSQVTPEQTTTALDEQAITSQVQIVRSRDLALSVARKLDFASRAEFNPALSGPSMLGNLFAAIGFGQKATGVDEEQILKGYYKKLSVYAIDKSRVIVVDFDSTDPKLAADAANAIAEGYIAFQREAKRNSTADAAQWLSAQIGDLRIKVQDAEAKVEAYRSQNDLFSSGGAADATLPQQQLTDLNTELGKVRGEMANAKAKADQIRNALKAGITPNVTEVLNSPLIQRLVEQQVALRSQIAQLSATLLPGHPRMQELNAQVADLDRQVASEAKKIVDALEAEAKLAQAREQEIVGNLTQLKVAAGKAGGAEVDLRALEREAAAQRDLLDSYLRRYREALSREQASLPAADARVISRATAPSEPSFPKKVPMTVAAALGALILGIAFILLRELASGRPVRLLESREPPPVPDAPPAPDHVRWADDRGMRRMMPNAPSLAPALVDRVEESLATIAGEIIAHGEKRVLVTMTEGSDQNGRPLAAVALARALARTDARVVVVDFRGDGANSISMGEGTDLPGFSDLFDGEASFAQVIFRDRRSRVHFIPAGRKPLTPELMGDDRLETIISALALTYDFVILDASDAMIAAVGGPAGVAEVVSEFDATDARTRAAFDRITPASDAKILLLVVDPGPATQPNDGSAAVMPREKASAGAAA